METNNIEIDGFHYARNEWMGQQQLIRASEKQIFLSLDSSFGWSKDSYRPSIVARFNHSAATRYRQFSHARSTTWFEANCSGDLQNMVDPTSTVADWHGYLCKIVFTPWYQFESIVCSNTIIPFRWLHERRFSLPQTFYNGFHNFCVHFVRFQAVCGIGWFFRFDWTSPLR